MSLRRAIAGRLRGVEGNRLEAGLDAQLGDAGAHRAQAGDSDA